MTAYVNGEDSLVLVDDIAVLRGGCPMPHQQCDFEYEGREDPVCYGGYIKFLIIFFAKLFLLCVSK